MRRYEINKKRFDVCMTDFKDEWCFRTDKRPTDEGYEELISEFCEIAHLRNLEPSLEKKCLLERAGLQALGYLQMKMHEFYKVKYLTKLFKSEYDFWIKECEEMLRYPPEEDEGWAGELVIFDDETEPPKYRETIAKTDACVKKGGDFLVSLFKLLILHIFEQDCWFPAMNEHSVYLYMKKHGIPIDILDSKETI